MGVIRKQSIQTTILSYAGFGLGYINAVLLFPTFFEPEEFGLTRVLIAVIGVSAQAALFGMSSAIIKFFPLFKSGDEKNHHGLLGLSLLWGLLGIALVGLILFLCQPLVIEYQKEGSALFVDYYYLLFPFLAFEVIYQLFANYARAMYHSAVNVFFKELFLRLLTTLLIALYYFNAIDFTQFLWLFVLQYAILVLGIAGYLASIKGLALKIDRAFLKSDLKRKIWHYRSFTSLTAISAHFLQSIDLIMVGYLVNLEGAAFYAVAVYIIAPMNIPRNAISSISLPVVSDAWKREDLETVQNVYAKTSINQLFFGVFIFVGLWANEANVFQMLPAEYAGGKWVLLFVGLGKLADIGFGLNGGVIVTSKWYKFDTYSNLTLLGITIILNLILIPIYGIVGAALATAISLCSFNIIKYTFLRMKFGFQPFSTKSLLTVILGLATYFISTQLPVQSHFVMDLVLRSCLITVIFLPAALFLRLSDDVNEFFKLIWGRIRS